MPSHPHQHHADNVFHLQAVSQALPGQHAAHYTADANCQPAAGQRCPGLAQSCCRGPAGVQHATSTLDQVLAEEAHAQALLLPTPFNISPIHVCRDDLLAFVEAQQYVAAHLGINPPLLNGTFVLVPSAQLPAPGFASSDTTSSGSGSGALALAAAIPWRLRQVLAVEVAPNRDPAEATVVLVGGDRVCAGAVGEGQLSEMPDHEYLCCEVAALQHQVQLRQLKVFDVAHVAWRLKVACRLSEATEAHKQGADGVGLGCFIRILQDLPAPGWTQDEVLPYFELNPYQSPASPDQPLQLLSTEQHTQLLQGAATGWQYYVQHKLAGQQPQHVMQFVPWQPLATDTQGVTENMGTASPVATGPIGSPYSIGSSCTAAELPLGDASAYGHQPRSIPIKGDKHQPLQEGRVPGMRDFVQESDEELLQRLFDDHCGSAEPQPLRSPRVPAQPAVAGHRTDGIPVGGQQAAALWAEAGRTFRPPGQQANGLQVEHRRTDPMVGRQAAAPWVEQGRNFPIGGQRAAGPRSGHEGTYSMKGKQAAGSFMGGRHGEHTFPAGGQRAGGPWGGNGRSYFDPQEGQRAAEPHGRSFAAGKQQVAGPGFEHRSARCYPQGNQQAPGPQFEHGRAFQTGAQRAARPDNQHTAPGGRQQAAGPWVGQKRAFPEGGQQAAGFRGGRKCNYPEGGQQAAGAWGGQMRTFPEEGQMRFCPDGGQQAAGPWEGRHKRTVAEGLGLGGQEVAGPWGGQRRIYPEGGQQAAGPRGGRDKRTVAEGPGLGGQEVAGPRDGRKRTFEEGGQHGTGPKIKRERTNKNAGPVQDDSEAVQAALQAVQAAEAQLKAVKEKQKMLERQQRKLLQWQQLQLQTYMEQQEQRAQASQQQPGEQALPSNFPAGMTPPPWAIPRPSKSHATGAAAAVKPAACTTGSQ